jgi:hypothetical protein
MVIRLSSRLHVPRLHVLVSQSRQLGLSGRLLLLQLVVKRSRLRHAFQPLHETLIPAGSACRDWASARRHSFIPTLPVFPRGSAGGQNKNLSE